ncbi:LysM peptidoglycan-binding domain-containing protein [Streptomyces harbinensis]|uniref:LysM peptidoglycan-binding domain-containing protein n=1 Tax=Streptomyces harbinensis TaxID=1176198 RepID=UPI0036A7602D
MQLISRTAWGAPATSPAAALPSARGVAVHYLGTRYDSRPHSQCAAMVRSIRASHLANKQENYADVAYNYLVCEHGYVYEGRGAGRRSGANGGTAQNTSHYAVCALHGTTGQPSDALLRGLAEAIAHLQQHGAGREVVCHGDLTATACPGGPLTSWVRAGHPLPEVKPGAGSTRHTVVRGETLTAIARRYGVTVAAIASANGLPDPDRIAAGQQLTIPKATAPARPKVSLARLIAAAKADPPKTGTPVSYSGVRTVEEALRAEGLLAGQYVDGHFGSVTVSAYAAWQRRCGYTGRDADGIPGRASLQRLGTKRGFDVTN